MSGGISKGGWSSPAPVAAAATSPRPSGAPCVSSLPCLFGAPKPMTVLQQIRVGRRSPTGPRGSPRQRLRVVPIDIGDHLPAVAAKARRRVIAEPARHLAIDGNAVVVVQSRRACRVRGCRRASRPRGKSPPSGSRRPERRRCDGRSPEIRARLNCAASSFSASAMPTALLTPWPSGPVVVSIPNLRIVFGMARRAGAKLAEVAQLRPSPGDNRTGSAARTRAWSRDRSTARNDRDSASGDCRDYVCRKSCHSTCGNVGHAHGHARVAGVGRLHGVHRQCAQGVGQGAAGGRWSAE